MTQRGRILGGLARVTADLRGLRLDADHDAGRPDLGILCVHEPGGRGSLVTSWDWRPAVRSVEVVPEALGSGRVAQLRHGLGLDLADPLPGDPVDLADLIKEIGRASCRERE